MVGSFFSVAAATEKSVNFQINGINLNDQINNIITFLPPISSILEFKVDNSTFSAEYGRNSGAILQALGIVWLLFTQAKRKQAEERSTGFAQLAESKHEALRQLTGRLLMLQDEERRRVAGELHDGLGQSLAIIKNRALIGLQDQTNHERALDQLGEIAEVQDRNRYYYVNLITQSTGFR